MIGAKETENPYVAGFREFEKRVASRPWLRSMRKEAIQRFAELGFPTTRMEAWKFTNVAPISRGNFALAPNGAIRSVDIDASALRTESARLVFLNGHFQPECSELAGLPDGVTVSSLALALDEQEGIVRSHLGGYAAFSDQAFVALNTAFIEDGAFIHVPKGIVLERPLHLLFFSRSTGQGTVSHPRVLIVLERETQAAIIEEHVGLDAGATFTNAVTEIIAGENAFVEHFKLQNESTSAFHVSTVRVEQGRTSNLLSHSISVGGRLVRNDLNVVLDGEGAECSLNGLYLAGDEQHVDNHTLIDHARAHCTSRELYKGILDGRATAVFNGAVIVRPDAQKSDASQTNRNLLLSGDAVINTKPQLEIFADDVRCTHGATIGQIDRDAVFYLRSRGIDEASARAMLTRAFAGEVFGRMRSESIRKGLEATLQSRLNFEETVL